MTQAIQVVEFDHYLSAVVAPECDLLAQWWERAEYASCVWVGLQR